MEALNNLELILLDKLVTKYPALATHITHLKVSKRQKSGFSLYVYFAYHNFNPQAEMINALFSNSEKITIPQLKEGLSYVIDVTAGQIEHIEFSSYKEEWDGPIGEFEIVESEIKG